jgi:DNA-binding MarR family transcriptional regulator
LPAGARHDEEDDMVQGASLEDRDGDAGEASTESMLRAFRQANVAFDLIGQTVAGEPSLGRTDLRLLELIVEDGPLSAGAIARSMGLTTGSVTALVDRLEAVRCVRRTSDPADGRRRIVTVTARGRRCRLRAYARLHSIVAAVTHDMDSAERAAVLGFLRRAEETCRSAVSPAQEARSA